MPGTVVDVGDLVRVNREGPIPSVLMGWWERT